MGRGCGVEKQPEKQEVQKAEGSQSWLFTTPFCPLRGCRRTPFAILLALRLSKHPTLARTSLLWAQHVGTDLC